MSPSIASGGTKYKKQDQSGQCLGLKTKCMVGRSEGAPYLRLGGCPPGPHIQPETRTAHLLPTLATASLSPRMASTTERESCVQSVLGGEATGAKMDHIGAQCGRDLDVTEILPARLSAGRFVNSEIKPNCFLASPCVSDLPIWVYLAHSRINPQIHGQWGGGAGSGGRGRGRDG